MIGRGSEKRQSSVPPMTEAIPEQPPKLRIRLRRRASLSVAFRWVVFVGLWMAVGWLFHLDGDSYLVVGVPLVMIFQLVVRKKPLVTLWIRDAESFRLSCFGNHFGAWFRRSAVDKINSDFPSGILAVPHAANPVVCVLHHRRFRRGIRVLPFQRTKPGKNWDSVCPLPAVIGCGTMLLGSIDSLGIVSQAHRAEWRHGDDRNREFCPLCAGLFCFGGSRLSRRAGFACFPAWRPGQMVDCYSFLPPCGAGGICPLRV